MAILAEELPFAIVAKDEHLDIVCSFCFASKQLRPLSRCIGCRVVKYCDKECQKKDWVNHKHECSFLVNCAPHVPDWMCRLIARIALKLRRGDEAQKATFNGRVYADLIDHRDEIQKDPRRAEVVASLLHMVPEYMGKKFAPSPDLIISIYGKIVINRFDPGMDGAGSGLYLGLSVHNHSCAPDVFVTFAGPKAILRSPNKDQKYSTNLTVGYTEILRLKKDRQEWLSTFYFVCTCKVCSDPTIDFMYGSIRSSCCPESYCLLDPAAKELTCNKCGAVSEITIDEAISANEEASVTCAMVDDELTQNSDTPNGLKFMVEKYEKLSKILSPYNVHLMMISKRLCSSALKLGDYKVPHKYALVHLPAYRRYIPIGNPQRSSMLTQAAVAMSVGVAPSRTVLQLCEEAFAASLVSNGLNDLQTTSMQQLINHFREVLNLSVG